MTGLHDLHRVCSKELIHLFRVSSKTYTLFLFSVTYSMRLVQLEGRRIARFLQRRDSSTSTSLTPSAPSSSPAIPEGPELTLSPTTTPVGTSKGFPASSQTLAIALSIIGFIVLGIAFWRIRMRRMKSVKAAANVADEGDIERQKDKWLAPSATAPLALNTVVAPAGVGWAPQFRSISGPEYVREAAKESKSPPPKRSRSPLPSLVSKPSQDPFADPRPTSAPPNSPGIREADHAISSPLSPQPYALSVSGYQVRGLWTKEQGTRDWDV
ncbi:uncharacterized protein EDB93DRAFT_942127 [Suillus bovinus]|uniref:uncharacterized protein n=1 Tax=Suillus bovinus TaxID=48563 RepID=UPI001B8699AF|nr:uncharacterized protein EDB93DRAFT_942127 [Suillus bovinus]KAG2131302.1 hypothetical protein EDB93DRAFT_942127 [Suillus bovinus]